MSFYDDGKQVLSNLESYYRESIQKEKKVVRQQSKPFIKNWTWPPILKTGI
jgi:hypothetical protein